LIGGGLHLKAFILQVTRILKKVLLRNSGCRRKTKNATGWAYRLKRK
jgi:hypothetical protein